MRKSVCIVLDHARGIIFISISEVKGALYIQMTPAEQHFELEDWKL